MQHQINKPIFIVGSPRSGTSILTWCLGQHPNILPLPESGWIGDLAVDLAIRNQIGTARGDRSTLSAMDIELEEFFASFGRTINDLILSHRKKLERKRKMRHRSSEPKLRWVDGTPEYSFHICGLRKLFPKALFIHIVRDVTSVVRSMLNFKRADGGRLVYNEQEAYDYWFRTVSSCLLAEKAYGPRVVFRLRYSDLMNAPKVSMRSVLKFVGERNAVACLNPLQERINSSNVPADFKLGDPDTDPAVVERATRLSGEIETTPPPSEASTAAADKIEAAFKERVQYVATLDSRYAYALQEVRALRIEQQQIQQQMRERYEAALQRLNNEQKKIREGYEAAIQRLQNERKEMSDGYEVTLECLHSEQKQMSEGYEAAIQRLQNEQKQMSEGYEAALERLRTENAKNAARAERLAKEIKAKRTLIEDLRARREHHKLHRLLFGHDVSKRGKQ